MGKSRTSPLQKTGSSIGVGGSIGGGGSGGRMGVMGGSGNTASFAQANPNGQTVTQLNMDGAQPQQVALQSQANAINNNNFSDTDTQDYHQLYNGRQYYQNQALSIDGRVATMNYLSDVPESGSMYSVSQNLNHALNNGAKLNANQQYVYNNLEASMHNLGYNLTLQRYDHEGAINGLLQSVGVNKNYAQLTESQLQSALKGVSFQQKSFVSTSYNDFKNAPASNPFTSRAVKVVYNAKAKTQAMMPGNGPGGALGEIILSGAKNTFKVTDVKFDGRQARHKGTQSYGAKGVTLYVDVE